MGRMRLFLFYTIMAWVSVFKPSEGNDMLDCCNAGRPLINQAPEDSDHPSIVALWLIAFLAISITLAWVGWLICLAVDMVA